MKKNFRIIDRLCHIRDASRLAMQFSEGMDKSEFMADLKTQSAVIRQIEIVGEAAGNIPREFCDANPHIFWQGITGMRHKLAHGYFGVDLDMVWKVVQVFLPELFLQVEEKITELEK